MATPKAAPEAAPEIVGRVLVAPAAAPAAAAEEEPDDGDATITMKFKRRKLGPPVVQIYTRGISDAALRSALFGNRAAMDFCIALVLSFS